MNFNSLDFLIFFPVVVSLYFFVKQKYRWVVLLIASYYFYMSWEPIYALLILFSTLIDYYAAIQIDKSKTRQRRKNFLMLSIFFNLGLLFTFKYFNFFNESFQDLLNFLGIPYTPLVLNVLLPVGISFYTFQTLSYTIDVYRNKIKPEKHLGIYSVYVAFFPQLVAGPIERAKNLLPQFFQKHEFNYKRVTDGLKLMLWGFFKKVVIADRLALVVDTIYNDPTNYSGIPLILGTVFFAFQIYCDFSGYSDIAIGAAKVLGITLMDNFKRPYLSKNISEFWRRWHISLSTWFQDYVFNPLYLRFAKIKSISKFGSKTKHTIAFGLSLLLGEALLGLWHGANWIFLFFGLYHGVAIFMYYMVRKKWDKMPRIIQIGLTFVVVNIGFIFFRANSLSDAIYIITHLLSGINLNFSGINVGAGWVELGIIFILLGFMELVHLIQEHKSIRSFLAEKPLMLRWTIYSVMVLFIIIFGMYNNAEFIYFQF